MKHRKKSNPVGPFLLRNLNRFFYFDIVMKGYYKHWYRPPIPIISFYLTLWPNHSGRIMKSLFIDLLTEIESRWPGSKVDIFTNTPEDTCFVTPSGYVNRFIQLSATSEKIQIIAKVIDLNNSDNRLMEHMQIDHKSIFKRGQGIEFEVTDALHVVDQIEIVLTQFESVFPK